VKGGKDKATMEKLKPGDMVVLEGLPPGFLDDLPIENQIAIRDMIGKPIKFNEITSWGRAELEFGDNPGSGHFIYVDPSFIRAVDK
jgi:hypothetical protein